jgi:hypothetical protein
LCRAVRSARADPGRIATGKWEETVASVDAKRWRKCVMWTKLIPVSLALSFGLVACGSNVDEERVSSLSSAVVQSCKPPLKLSGDQCVGYCPADAPLIVVPPRPTMDYRNGFLNPTGVSLNGDATLVADTGGPCDSANSDTCLIRLTAAGGSFGRSSVFGTTALPVGVFYFSTRVKVTPAASNPADGFTLTLQAVGPQAIGGTGGGLAFGPDPSYPDDPIRGAKIGQSVAIKFDLWSNAGEGTNSTGLYLNGASPTNLGSIDLTPSGINLHSGNELEITLEHDGGELTETIRDVVTGAVFTHTYTINVAEAIGSPTAYVGFTGATGMSSVDVTIGELRFGESNTMSCAATCPPDRPRVGNRCVTECPPALPYQTLGGVCAASCRTGFHHQGRCVLQCPAEAPIVAPGGACWAERAASKISYGITGRAGGQPFDITGIWAYIPGSSRLLGGEYSVFVDDVLFEQRTLVDGSRASTDVVIPALSTGVLHTFRIEFAGNSYALPSSASFQQSFNDPTTTTTVSASTPTLVAYQPVSFTASVAAGVNHLGEPYRPNTGTVEFFVDGQSSGSARPKSGLLNLNGVLLGAGSHSVRAVYTEADPFWPSPIGYLSSEGTLTQLVAKAESNLVVTAPSGTLAAGADLAISFSSQPVAPSVSAPSLSDAVLRCSVDGVVLPSCYQPFTDSGSGPHTFAVQFLGDADFNPSPVASITYTR